MKFQAFNPHLPSWEYIPDAEPHVLATDFMFTALTTDLTDLCSA